MCHLDCRPQDASTEEPLDDVRALVGDPVRSDPFEGKVPRHTARLLQFLPRVASH